MKYKGQIIKILSNLYTVLSDCKYYSCSARKSVINHDPLYVGDFVDIEPLYKDKAQICGRYERKNCMIRPYVANIDVLVIVVAPTPEIDFILVDKLIINSNMNNIKTIICLNKCDIDVEENAFLELMKNYGSICDIYKLSAINGNGIIEFAAKLKGKLIAFAGQSAVGKSSIVNALAATNLTKTGGLSRIDRGRNTTRHTEIYDINGVRIADTCGFSSFEIIENPSKLYTYYDDFMEYQQGCKFSTCNHIFEPDCAVKRAVERGEIPIERYERYVIIYNEWKKRWKQYE